MDELGTQFSEPFWWKPHPESSARNFTNISTAGMSGYGRIVDPPTGMFAESRDGREVLG